MGAALVPGITIDRYRVDAEIGAGSMGDVFMAVDVELGRKVALKILSERHRDNDELRARFVREARAVAAISHPNVVQVFTTGSFDDRPYIAMEFLDGVDLGTDVKVSGPWSSLQAARAVLDAAHGLEAAAKAGLIHRDVKPSNLVLLATGKVKVTDFGLAKPLDPGDEPALTAMGVVVGTPDYIAPEQARGDPIDERVDIYALGGTLYYLLTGIPPFRTGNKAEDKYLKVVARHLRKPAPDPRERAASVDPEVAELTKTLMAKKPGERPGYPELARMLDGIVVRLAAGGGPPRSPTQSGTGGRVAPTPFVGGAAPRPADFEGGVTHGLAPAGAPEASLDDMESAPTNLRMPTAPPDANRRVEPPAEALRRGSGQASFEVRPPRASRLLIALTVIAMLVFLVGLGLLLFGPLPERSAGADPVSETVPPPAPPDAAPLPPPETPAGMVLVRKPDGQPWLFVSAHPVSWAEYQAVYPNHRKPRREPPEGPVTNVTYGFADSYAQAKGARLPTSDEWAAGAATEGFEGGGERLYEWVGGGDSARPTVRSQSTTEPTDTREPKAHGDVSFRLARDL